MKKGYLSFIIITMMHCCLHAQQVDSLVYFSELKFSSNFEKSTFENIQKSNDEVAYFKLFYAMGNPVSEIDCQRATAKFNDFTTSLSLKIKDKNEAEKIKLITEEVKKTFLKTHNLNSHFSALFEEGNFNYLTSITLYNLVLSRLKIPCVTIEEHNTLYLLAYPKVQKIKIESGAVENNYFNFPDHLMNKYVKSLYYARIIPIDEFKVSKTDQLFDKYYFKNDSVKMLELASIAYLNQSISASEHKHVEEAISQLQKAYLLFPSLRIKTVLKHYVISALGIKNYREKEDINNLIYLSRYNNLKDVEITSEFILSEYLNMQKSNFTNYPDTNLIHQNYSLLLQNIKDNALIAEIKYNYHYEIAAKAVNSVEHRYVEFSHLTGAYALKPANKEIQSLITACFNEEIQASAASETVSKIIDKYCLHFEFICNSATLIILKINCYLDIAGKKFNANFENEGIAFINKSEQLIKKNGINPDIDFVEKGYVSAAKYYYNKGNKVKAKEYLTRGLQLAPESMLIQERLQFIK